MVEIKFLGMLNNSIFVLPMRFLTIILLLFLFSCVSKKNYTDALNQNKTLNEEKTSLEELLNKLAMENDSLKQENEVLDSLIRVEREKNLVTNSKKDAPKTRAKKSSLSKADEADKKALFIYNFTSYVSWPKFNSDKFLIGVVGNTGVKSMLENYTKGKSFAKAPIEVQTYKAGVNYQIVFVSAAGANDFAKVKKENAGKAVLLITENTLYNKIGAHIGFYVDGDKVNFQVNKEAIEKAGMNVSAKLVHFSHN